MPSRCTVKIVSFSGIDGAGKSTQIDALETWLAQAGLRVKLLTFWDDVVVLSRFREVMSHAAFKGDQGIGSPEKPLQRRDKNVTAWPVRAIRFGLYLLDAIHLGRVTSEARKTGADVVIFDRYIYDELANLTLMGWPTRTFIRLVLKLVPKPDVAYLIDADPVTAFARKPEYPLEFLRSNREAYLALSRLTGQITVIEPGSVEAMASDIRNAFLQKRSSPEAQLMDLAALQQRPAVSTTQSTQQPL
jgi:thymidylate kinase